jgi:REP element-mobilizing transposase RayT
MPYVRIWVHLVWSTKNREPILGKDIRLKVFEHIRANARAKNIFLDTIGGYVDHVHALVSLGPDQTIAKVAQLLKGESSHWVNKESLTQTRFEWQDEYAAFSVSESAVEAVRSYISGQEEHHHRKAFAEEYQEILTRHGFTSGGLKSP